MFGRSRVLPGILLLAAATALPGFVPPQMAYPQGPSGPFDVLPTDPVQGPMLAPITILAFSDFQCPFCRRGFEVLAELQAKNPGKIRVVWKDFPLAFHLLARPAARAGRVVFMTQGHEAFFRFHHDVYSAKYLTADALDAAAAANGASKSAVAKWSLEADRLIDASIALGTKLGVVGTPQFYIDGEPLGGAQPLDKFQAIVDTHLVEARALEMKGVPKAAIQRALVAKFAPQKLLAP